MPEVKTAKPVVLNSLGSAFLGAALPLLIQGTVVGTVTAMGCALVGIVCFYAYERL